ncbi:MAG: hypothetical protein NTW48_09285 [Chloroflexi bacterium]|nr:hypothetical protein [Chloroflexota bacterium]
MSWTSIDISKGWMPDFIKFGMPPGGLQTCKNLLPYDEGYWPCKMMKALSTDALTEHARRARGLFTEDGNYIVFIGGSTSLFRYNPDKSVDDVTRTASDYTSGGNSWNFEKYGDWCVATNFADEMQVLKTFSAGATFEDLTGAPQAKFIKFYSGHLVAGHIANSPKLVKWSALEDLEDWTISTATGADEQNITDAEGEITGIERIGKVMGVFFSNSISLMYFSGSPYTYTFVPNAINNVGAIENTIVSTGSHAFFWDSRDIWAFDGSNVEPLGYGIRNTISGLLNKTYINRVSAVVDQKRSLVFWSFPSTSSADGTCDLILAYNYRSKKYSLIEMPHFALHSIYTGALTLEELSGLYPNIDEVPYSLDSSFWMAGSPQIAGVNVVDDKVATMDGSVLISTLQTPVIKIEDNVVMVSKVRPRLQGAVDEVSVRIASRMNEDDLDSYSDVAIVSNSSGYADVRASGRYLSVEITSSLHDGILDMEIEGVGRGKR